MAERATKPDSQDADLKELREEFSYAQAEKRDIREEGARDMRAISGDAWDPEDRKERDDNNRPCLSLDELGQYVNQLINDVRQNKRSIKAAPQGLGATDKTAEFRQNLIRQIEYRSNAQQAYSVMFENTAQRSYGYLRITPEYTSHRSNDQELRIVSVPNPDLVVEDPAAQRTDGTDWTFLYFAEEWTRAAFKRKFKNAKVTDFSLFERFDGVKDWIKASRILVAERWRIETVPKKLFLVTPPAPRDLAAPPPVPFFALEDDREFKARPAGSRVEELRVVDYPTVKKQITNGVEILEETDFPGTSIPFVSCYGKVLYLDVGDGPKKKMLSLIRLARDPLMLYCFYRTQQAEMAGMVPKVPVGGYKGQFAGVETDWQRAPHEPLAFLEFNFEAAGWNPSWGPMPRPSRIEYSAGEHLQALELCAEGARRAIQAAIGASPLPTQAQRHNEKSGIALQKMDESAQRGSFHFVDHFDDALLRTGTILNELIPHYYDTARDVTIRKADDQPAKIRINDPTQPDAVDAMQGEHDMTISVGPRQASEREAASDFADTMIGSQLIQLMPPPLALKIVALAVRLKAVGPIGDEIADLLSPKDDGQPQGPTPEQVQQMQAQIADLTGKLQQAAQALETDQAKQQAQVEIHKIEAQMKAELAEKQAQLEIALLERKNAASIEIARISAAKQAADAEAEAAEERLATGLELQHKAEQAELDRQHEIAMEQMKAQAAEKAAQRPRVKKTVTRDAQGQISEINEEQV